MILYLLSCPACDLDLVDIDRYSRPSAHLPKLERVNIELIIQNK